MRYLLWLSILPPALKIYLRAKDSRPETLGGDCPRLKARDRSVWMLYSVRYAHGPQQV